MSLIKVKIENSDCKPLEILRELCKKENKEVPEVKELVEIYDKNDKLQGWAVESKNKEILAWNEKGIFFPAEPEMIWRRIHAPVACPDCGGKIYIGKRWEGDLFKGHWEAYAHCEDCRWWI